MVEELNTRQDVYEWALKQDLSPDMTAQELIAHLANALVLVDQLASKLIVRLPEDAATLFSITVGHKLERANAGFSNMIPYMQRAVTRD